MNTIEGVLFDLDETVLDRQTSLDKFLSWQFGRHYRKHSALEDAWKNRFFTLDDYGSDWSYWLRLCLQ